MVSCKCRVRRLGHGVVFGFGRVIVFKSVCFGCDVLMVGVMV